MVDVAVAEFVGQVGDRVEQAADLRVDQRGIRL